jgi:2-dehydro-3-deoxyphosphogluconate aldolase/(4S)-4-hydroxy-2-oxoglutarate aldolase
MIAKMTEALRDRRLIFIIRVGVSAHVVDMVETIWRAGGSFVEVTLNTPDAVNAISSLRTRPPDGCYLGAGTVMNPRDAESAHEAGASFVVTPVASSALVSRIGELGLMGVIGASTPTEVHSAHCWGADFVKVFPAQSADYIKAIRAPMSEIPLVAVGGITRENAIKYLKVGCSAVGVGGSFLPVEPDGSFDPSELETSVRTMVRVCSLTSE